MRGNEKREKKDVFISYKSEDYSNALWVKGTLEVNGISCWMAPNDIPGGSNYGLEIPTAIKNCTVMVVVLTMRTKESEWVPKEIGQAISEHKIIMPFLLEEYSLPTEYNFYLTNVQRYDAFLNKSETICRMVEEIRTILGFKNAEFVPFEDEAPVEEQPSDATSDNTVGKNNSKRNKKQKRGKKKERKKRKHRLRNKIKEIKTWPRKKKIIALCIVVFLVLVVFLWCDSTHVYLENSYKMLISTDDFKKEEIPEVRKTLKSRLDTLCEDEKYTLHSLPFYELTGNSFYLIIPKSVFGKNDPGKVIDSYICSSGNLSYSDNDSDKQPIEKLDILNIDYSSSDDFPLSVVITDDCFNRVFTDKMNIESITLYVDEEVKLTAKISEENKHTLLITDEYASGKYLEYIYLALKEGPKNNKLYSLLGYEPIINWSLNYSENENVGRNQVDKSELKLYSVIYRFEFKDNPSSGAKLDAKNALINRFDSYYEDYAVGKLMDNDGQGESLYIKTLAYKTSEHLMDLLCESADEMFLETNMVRMPLRLNDDDSVGFSSSGIKFDLSDSTMKQVKEFLAASGEKQGAVYLGFGKNRYMFSSRDEFLHRGYIEFLGICSERTGLKEYFSDDIAKSYNRVITTIIEDGFDMHNVLSYSKWLRPYFIYDPESFLYYSRYYNGIHFAFESNHLYYIISDVPNTSLDNDYSGNGFMRIVYDESELSDEEYIKKCTNLTQSYYESVEFEKLLENEMIIRLSGSDIEKYYNQFISITFVKDIGYFNPEKGLEKEGKITISEISVRMKSEKQAKEILNSFKESKYFKKHIDKKTKFTIVEKE